MVISPLGLRICTARNASMASGGSSSTWPGVSRETPSSGPNEGTPAAIGSAIGASEAGVDDTGAAETGTGEDATAGGPERGTGAGCGTPSGGGGGAEPYTWPVACGICPPPRPPFRGCGKPASKAPVAVLNPPLGPSTPTPDMRSGPRDDSVSRETPYSCTVLSL